MVTMHVYDVHVFIIQIELIDILNLKKYGGTKSIKKKKERRIFQSRGMRGIIVHRLPYYQPNVFWLAREDFKFPWDY